MRKLILLIILFSFLQKGYTQDVTFTFINAQITNDGSFDYYEADIQIESAATFSLGSGLLYFNYNSSAFGNNVHTNGNLQVLYPAGYMVSDSTFGQPMYKDFITNDNTNSRFGFSFQQNLPGAFIGTNVTATPTNLFHIKIKYVNVVEDPMICFEFAPPLDDQFYTSAGTPIQITNDNFDCTGAALASLPVELISFSARAENQHSRLYWSTASELNNEGFEIERLGENDKWETLDFVFGKGTTNEINDYIFYDKNPKSGINYYRLKQIDFDGKYEYSNIESVTFEERNLEYSIFPNPTLSENVNVKIPNDETEVSIYDSKSRLMYVLKMDKGIREISLNQFSAGMYFVKFMNGSDVQIKRLIISN